MVYIVNIVVIKYNISISGGKQESTAFHNNWNLVYKVFFMSKTEEGFQEVIMLYRLNMG